MRRNGSNGAIEILDGADEQVAKVIKAKTGSSTRRGPRARRRANSQRSKARALVRIKPRLNKKKRKWEVR